MGRVRNSSHKGNVEKLPSGRYRIRLCIGGKRFARTLEAGTTKADAKVEADRWYGELLHMPEGMADAPRILRLGQLFDDWEAEKRASVAPRTWETYGNSLTGFRTFFLQRSDPPVDQIRPAHVAEFLRWRAGHDIDGTLKAKPLSSRSVAKERATLHAVFERGVALEMIGRNPVATVPTPKGDSRQPLILNADQYEALLASCEGRPMLWAYVHVLGEAGLRAGSEALWLRWEDVDLDKRQVTVESVRKGRRTKSGRMRIVPMTSRLRDVLQEHAARFRLQLYGGERSPWLFHHPTTRTRVRAGDRITGLRRGFDAAVVRAGLSPELNQHDLRHRRVTVWLAEGFSPALVQKAMGHAQIATTLGYSHLVASDLMALVDDDSQRRAVR